MNTRTNTHSTRIVKSKQNVPNTHSTRIVFTIFLVLSLGV